MDFSEIKLIATDMDGTLLNSNHEVSNWFYKLFEKIKQHNILFVAASGRPYYGMTSKLAKIKDDIIFVSENGGVTMKNDELLLTNALEKENLEELFNLVISLNNTHAVFCGLEGAFVMSDSEKLRNLLSEFYPVNTVITSINEITAPIFKVALFHEESSEQFIYPHIQHLEARFKVKVSANHWVDVSEANANKGFAISNIQKKYGISEAETMAFGDYKNDIEMLEVAKYSFAMDNAHEDVKAIANFNTKSNDANGVEIIIDQVIQAKEAKI